MSFKFLYRISEWGEVLANFPLRKCKICQNCKKVTKKMGIYDKGAKIQVLNVDFALEVMGDMDIVKEFFKSFRDETLKKNLEQI